MSSPRYYEVELDVDRMCEVCTGGVPIVHGETLVERLKQRIRDLTCYQYKIEASAYLLEASVMPNRRPTAPITALFANEHDCEVVKLVLGRANIKVFA